MTRKSATDQKLDDLLDTFNEYKKESRDDFRDHVEEGKGRFAKVDGSLAKIHERINGLECSEKGRMDAHDDLFKEYNGQIDKMQKSIDSNQVELKEMFLPISIKAQIKKDFGKILIAVLTTISVLLAAALSFKGLWLD